MAAPKQTLRFKNGKLIAIAPPAWFKKAMAEDGDWMDLLSKAGARGSDEYGDVDAIQILRAPDDSYLICFWDPNESIAQVFIDNVADYLTFKAQYIAPLAQLSMVTDQHLAWERSQSKKSKGK